MKHKYYRHRIIDDIRKAALDDEFRMQVQYRYVLKILILVVLIASVVNMLTDRFTMGIITFLLGGMYFALYWVIYFKKNKGVKIVNAIMVVSSTILCIEIMTHGTINGTAPIWILLYPILALLLTGRKIGTLSSMFVFGAIVFLYWTPLGNSFLDHTYDSVFLQRYPFIFLVMFAISYFYDTLRVVVTDELQKERKRMESVYQNQYSSIENRIAEAKKIRHDLRHHFLMISQYLKDNQIEEAQKYISQYYDALPFEEALTYCNHYATNALLTYYVQFAKENDIPVDIELSIPKEIDINTEDLTVVFGNLLENAVHANIAGLKADSEFDPWIRIRGNYNGNALIFSIENASHQEAKKNSSGQFYSTKHEGVGIGVHSVQEMVEKYNGVFQVEQPSGIYRTKIIMYANK